MTEEGALLEQQMNERLAALGMPRHEPAEAGLDWIAALDVAIKVRDRLGGAGQWGAEMVARAIYSEMTKLGIRAMVPTWVAEPRNTPDPLTQ